MVKSQIFCSVRVTQREFTINFICYLKHPVPGLSFSCKYAKKGPLEIVPILGGPWVEFSSHLGAEEFRTSGKLFDTFTNLSDIVL